MPVPSTSPLRASRRSRIGERWRIDGRTFGYVMLAVLGALALVAVTRSSSAMLTRIGVGILIALALDPVVDAMERRVPGRRGLAVTVVGVLVIGIATLIVAVLGPRAVDEARQFSDQLPDTVRELERLPLVGGWVQDQDFVGRAQKWVDELPEQFTDDRLAQAASTLVSGVVSIAVVAVVAVAVLIDGEDLIKRFRRLLKPARRRQADEVGRVVYRTIGRYIGGSLTVALMMGVFVLTVGLALGVPLTPLAAIWAMLTDLIPQVGGALGGGFFVLLAVTAGVPTAIIAAGLFVLYMNIENHIIQPAIVGRSVGLTAPTTMVAAFVGGAVAGVPGALVATPMVGAAKQLFLEVHGRKGPEPEHDPRRNERLLRRVTANVKSLLPKRSGITALGALALLTVGPAAPASTPAPPDPADPSDAPAAATVPPLVLTDGVFVAPDRSFTIAFSVAPIRSVDTDTDGETFASGVDEDRESLTRYPLSAFGGDPAATTSGRVDGFLDASGTVITELARVDTTLWSYAATYFIDEMSLDSGSAATLYGLVITRDDRAVYVVYTDVGGDDNATAVAFMESYTVLVSSYRPAPPAGVPTTSSAPSTSVAGTATATSVAGTATATTLPLAPATSGAPSTSAPAEAAVTSVDGLWTATFPNGATPTYSASMRAGFAYSLYIATAGDDTVSVRATQVPTGYEWVAANVPGAVAAAAGGTVERSAVTAVTAVTGREAVRFSYTSSAGDTVYVLSSRAGAQIVDVVFVDAATPSPGAAERFLDSFTFAA